MREERRGCGGREGNGSGLGVVMGWGEGSGGEGLWGRLGWAVGGAWRDWV